MDWIGLCSVLPQYIYARSARSIYCGFTSNPTQHRLYGIRFLQVKRPNQQYRSTEGQKLQRKTQETQRTIHTEINDDRDSPGAQGSSVCNQMSPRFDS